MDAFMKEIGVGMAVRMMAKGMKPRIVISENGGKWSLRSDNSLKKISIEFIPDVEFDETTPDGREVKVYLYISCRNHALSLIPLFTQFI
jgi:hypothetical protein